MMVLRFEYSLHYTVYSLMYRMLYFYLLKDLLEEERKGVDRSSGRPRSPAQLLTSILLGMFLLLTFAPTAQANGLNVIAGRPNEMEGIGIDHRFTTDGIGKNEDPKNKVSFDNLIFMCTHRS